MLQTYEGGCHCRQIRFRVTADLDKASECNCSMCTMKGFVHVVVERDQFELLQGEQELSEYRFNTGVARHLFCRHCGVHSFYVPRSDPSRIDVNARCLDGVDLKTVKPVPFDGQNWEQAIEGKLAWR